MLGSPLLRRTPHLARLATFLYLARRLVLVLVSSSIICMQTLQVGARLVHGLYRRDAGRDAFQQVPS